MRLLCSRPGAVAPARCPKSFRTIYIPTIHGLHPLRGHTSITRCSYVQNCSRQFCVELPICYVPIRFGSSQSQPANEMKKAPSMGPFFISYGAPGEIRTPDLMVRSHALYPTELRARIAKHFVSFEAALRQILSVPNWRRERDSNPRWAFDPYALSRGAPSTTRPSLRCQTCSASIFPSGLRLASGARYFVRPCTPPHWGHSLQLLAASNVQNCSRQFCRPLGHLSGARSAHQLPLSRLGVERGIIPRLHALHPFGGRLIARATERANVQNCS
jgi:hypothetical protein